MFLRSFVGQCTYPPAAIRLQLPFLQRTALDTQLAPLQEMPGNSDLLDPAHTGSQELVVQALAHLSAQLHPGSLKEAMTRVFTPWKWANAVNLFLPSPRDSGR